jgi:hypothetical protein
MNPRSLRTCRSITLKNASTSAPVPVLGVVENLASRDVRRSEQIDRSVALVIVHHRASPGACLGELDGSI